MCPKLSVVLVDDSPSALASLTRALEAIEGVEVVGTAEDGLMAVTVVKNRRPDLVLMDIVMPHLDGLAALRLVLAARPDVRVAMISSLGGSASRAEQAFRLGACQVISKPIDPEQLAALVEAEIERKRDSSPDAAS